MKGVCCNGFTAYSIPYFGLFAGNPKGKIACLKLVCTVNYKIYFCFTTLSMDIIKFIGFLCLAGKTKILRYPISPKNFSWRHTPNYTSFSKSPLDAGFTIKVAPYLRGYLSHLYIALRIVSQLSRSFRFLISGNDMALEGTGETDRF